MIVALLISTVILTSRGPVLAVTETHVSDVGACKNMAYTAQREQVWDASEPNVPYIVGCFGYSKQAGLPLIDDYMTQHVCAVKPVKVTFGTDGYPETLTYGCLKL